MKNDKTILPEIFEKTRKTATKEISKTDLFEIKPKQLEALYELALGNTESKEKWKAWSPKTKRSAAHDKELIRAYFGEDADTEIKPAVSRMLSRLGIYVDGENKNAEFEYGENKNASTAYRNSVVKITVKAKEGIDSRNDLTIADKETSFSFKCDDCFHIINTVDKIKKKTLSPANLGLKEKFENKEKILEKISTGLENKSLEKFSGFFQNVCTNISGGKTANGISDLTKENIEYVIADLSGEVRPDTWMAEFENDFGEIMGPLMLMDRIPDAEIYFPSKSNEPGYDYKLLTRNGEIKISAKARGGSNNSLKNIIENNLNNLDDLKKQIRQDLSLEDEKSEEVNDFLDILEKTYKEPSYIWKQTLLFAEKFKDEKIFDGKSLSQIFSSRFELSDFSKIAVKANLEEKALSKAESKTNPTSLELEEVLKGFYEDLDFSVKGDFYRRLAGVWPKNKNVRFGCVFYPLTVAVVKCLNNSELYKKVLEYCSRRIMEYCVKIECVLDNEQSRLTVKFNVYDLKANNEVKFEFIQGASIWQPFNKSIGINVILPETN